MPYWRKVLILYKHWIIFWIVVAGLVYWLAPTWTGHGFCSGYCERFDVTRKYVPEMQEFSVESPYDINGDMVDATNRFKLGELKTIRGMGYSYFLEDGNEHGQDVKLMYLPPDKVDYYVNNFVKPGVECPAAWMHQNLQIYILVGATNEISKQLRDYQWTATDNGGAPYAYEGHVMNYDSSLVNGNVTQLVPAMYEDAYSNKGYARKDYVYFLVTNLHPAAEPETVTFGP